MFEPYPKLVEIDVIDEIIEMVAKKLLGSIDPSGIDSISMARSY